MPDSVFVIGGGPAGLAAAIAARRRGFQVTLADARRPPIDKACGEGLMPGGVEAARELGMHLDAAEPMRGVRFLGAGRVFEAAFPGNIGYGIRRLDLQMALVREAERTGVELRWDTPVRETPQSRWMVRATGSSQSCAAPRYGFRQHFRLRRWTDLLEIYWAPGLQVYVTPVRPDEVGIAVLSRDPKLRVPDALLRFPELRERLGAAVSAERGSVTGFRSALRVVEPPNVALVGDASGTVDAITGEGLALSFRQAFALADAMGEGDLSQYAVEHRRLFRKPRLMEHLLLTLDESERARALSFSAMQHYPAIFRAMLALHVHS